MGKIIINLILELMISLMPLNGGLLVYDEYDLMNIITEEIVQKTGFTVSQAGDELNEKELIILGLTDENLGKVKELANQLPNQACIFIYCVGAMKIDETESQLCGDLKNQKTFFLFINDDEIGEEQWVKECVNKKLLEIWMYQFVFVTHNNNAVRIG